jgi:hypothetical protein
VVLIRDLRAALVVVLSTCVLLGCSCLSRNFNYDFPFRFFWIIHVNALILKHDNINTRVLGIAKGEHGIAAEFGLDIVDVNI